MPRPPIISYALSDTGIRRTANQDAYLLDDELGVYLVADGMGGHAGGEVAAAMAVESVHDELAVHRELLDAGTPAKQQDVLEAFAGAVSSANDRIRRRARSDQSLYGMGTTFTGVAFAAGQAFLAHVGDSRCYQIRSGAILQLSEDHTLVEEMIRAGLLSPEERATSPMRHVLSRSVGAAQEVTVDLMSVPTQPGDIFVLCSDGLANVVEASEIRDTVLGSFLRDVPRELVALANSRGGPDNITIVVLAVEPRESTRH